MKNVLIILSLLFAGFNNSNSLTNLNFQDGVIYTAVDENPEFIGGERALRNFLKINTKFPEEAMKAKVNGRVTAKFVVETDGTLSNIKILKGLGYGCDEETVRVIKSMPKWTPGKSKNVAVRTYFTFPVSFLTK